MNAQFKFELSIQSDFGEQLQWLTGVHAVCLFGNESKSVWQVVRWMSVGSDKIAG